MSRIPQSFIDDLLSRLDIVEVVDRRVKLKKAGKNYSACCPFHDEKTPSFTVSPDKQFYYCFGCGATGNAIGFVMEYERSGFVDAVESLASHAGVEVPRESNSAIDHAINKRKPLYDILKRAAEYYQKQLKHHPSRMLAVNYLKGRGLTGSIAKDYQLGYSPKGWDNLLLALGQNELDVQHLIDSGAVIDKPETGKRYDRFRERIIFPIRDSRGRNIGFGGRVLGNDKPKYLNSPETDVFHKGKELYGLYECLQRPQKPSQLMVVEGYMDVIALAQFGIYNAVATLGTACGEDHLTLVFRHVSQVIFCFDGDNAGRNAAKRALTNSLSSMTDGRQIKFLFLPDGQDPDSLVRQIGAERFENFTQSAIPLEEFLFEVAAEGIDVKSMDGRARFSKIAAPLLAELPEGVFRELMFDNLAKRTGLTSEQLRELQKDKIELAIAPPENTPPPRQEPDRSAPHQPNPGELREHASNIDYAENTAPKGYSAPPSIDYDEPPVEAYYHALESGQDENTPARKQLKTSRIELTPAKIATILLLENPKLAEKIQAFDLNTQNDSDLSRLQEILSYLQRRPNSNFNNVMGYWAGSHGIDAQQELAELVANQCFGSVKSIDTYDASSELLSALQTIKKQQEQLDVRRELDELQRQGLKQLSPEKRQRMLELIALTRH